MIDKAFYAIPHMHVGSFTAGAERLFALALEGETQHRRGHPPIRGFSANAAARYFAVKWLREYVLYQDRIPDIRGILDLRPDVIYAAALVSKFAEVLSPWVDTVPADFDAIDYAELMK
jgi:hypothetical protein